MDTNSKDIDLQIIGYASTPFLWTKQTVLDLKQLEYKEQNNIPFNESVPLNLRLGKRVERYVSAELKNNKTISILAENIQIQNDKLTIGEIDCILKQDNRLYHVEIIFKFYLFDATVGTTELEHWIGPNRNDTLIKKLTKLKEKQLPLLYNIHTKPTLDALNIEANDIEQRVFFKAQLFTPYKRETIVFNTLNEDCVQGFYINVKELGQFNDCKFYIPSKVNWLQNPQAQVNWLQYNNFTSKIHTLVADKKSPLCWIKFPNGKLQKFFVVWWQ
ncbi:DUF1853 family protein [Cellulophaga fucicola]|uniref:DUF1853 family protein n=1 Tax=Cellulophaga fucicola TaxID=76595 RepID=UPI003EBEDF51